jgi:hypothetical protein
MRERFELICGKGAPADVLPTAGARPDVVELVPNQRLRHAARSPGSLVLTDHFPRRPVFPGTMLLDAQITIVKTSRGVAALGTRDELCRFVCADMKMRAFVPPGEGSRTADRLQSDRGEPHDVQDYRAYEGKRAGVGLLEIEGKVSQ